MPERCIARRDGDLLVGERGVKPRCKVFFARWREVHRLDDAAHGLAVDDRAAELAHEDLRRNSAEPRRVHAKAAPAVAREATLDHRELRFPLGALARLDVL